MKGLDLTLVHMLNPPVVMAFPEVPMPAGFLKWQEEEGRTVLDAALVAARAVAPDIEISTEMVAGPSVPTLVEESRNAQMIVVGCRGRGALARGLLGSVSHQCTMHAPCPVVVVHP